jgi:hypothetical protein
MKKVLLLVCLPLARLLAQEAGAGIDLRATITGEAVSTDGRTTAGFRAVAYPTIKLSEHWTLSGSIEMISRPFAPEDFATQGYGARMRVLQSSLGYSRVWKKASLVVRVGQLPSAVGSFNLRYDDADNPLTDSPMEYGYYGKGITTLGLAGAQADLTVGRWDARGQFTNSSPANALSVFEGNQYGAWAVGTGYTIRQGLRVGLSGYRGPYMDDDNPYYFPGPGGRRALLSSAFGADAEWAHGHWNFKGEWQRFNLAYFVIPTLREDAGYVEVKRVLHPRWYVAGRAGYLHPNFHFGGETYEAVVGFRPNSSQIVKIGYEIARDVATGKTAGTITGQLVTTLHPLSIGWR